MYRSAALLLAATLFLGCSNSATPVAEPEPTPPKISPAELAANADSAFEALMGEFNTAKAEFRKILRSTPRDKKMAMSVSGGPKKEFASKFLDLANEYPESDVHYKAIQIAAENGDTEVALKAFDLLVGNYRDDDKIVGLLETFERKNRLPAEHHESFLKNLMDKSTKDSVKGPATYMLVKFYQQVGTMKEMASDPETASAFPKETVDYWLKNRGDNFNGELEGLLANVAENYADVEFGKKGKLGALAEEELFVFKYLSVGKTAPDIDGRDLDDEEFKLSDYRGKVVMLDFWGDW